MPEIKVEGYKELRADRPEIAVTDEEVQQSLDGVREQHATFTSVEGRALADGDYAQVSLDGKPKDAPENSDDKPVHMDEVLVEIAGKNTMPEFTENLRGASPGDERVFEVTYAQDAQEQRLAGKTFTYTVKVQSIKQKTLPDLDDQFATQLGEFKTLDEVRQRIREGMESERKHAAEHEAKDKLVAELVKRTEFEVPEALVDRQIDVRLERGLRALAAQGMKAEDIKKMGLNLLAGWPKGAGAAGSEGIARARQDRGGGENRGQRRGDRSGDRSARHTVKADAGCNSGTFDTCYGALIESEIIRSEVSIFYIASPPDADAFVPPR